MDQELMMHASMLEKQSQEIEQNLEIIDTQILELEKFQQNIEFFSKSEEKQSISSLGRGVFVKTSLENKDLFVDVGSGIIIKKTPEQTQKTIKTQIENIQQARVQLLAQLEATRSQFQALLQQIETSEKKK
tara:strand:- start:1171 stop:1563 length:393 start_codon:yes stop_codon:yes gene_type:complete